MHNMTEVAAGAPPLSGYLVFEKTGRPPGDPSDGGWVPEDSFADRLARVRRRMGWNFSEAGRACGVTGQSWRLWEQHDRPPRDLLEVAKKIAEGTGCDVVWLLTGRRSSGPLAPTVPYVLVRALPRGLSGDRFRLAAAGSGLVSPAGGMPAAA
jgi:transcriptional regulator with XRE-family HTH domain